VEHYEGGVLRAGVCKATRADQRRSFGLASWRERERAGGWTRALPLFEGRRKFFSHRLIGTIGELLQEKKENNNLSLNMTFVLFDCRR
jgi:hypothetical protein